MRGRGQRRTGRARAAIVAIVAVLMSLLGVGLGAPASASTTLVVDDNLTCPGAGFSSISAAVAAAVDGETIQVCAGVYNENFTDNAMKLTFLGPQQGVNPSDYPTSAGEAVIDGGGHDPVIQFFRASTLNGFTVKDGPRGIIADAGSTIRSSSFTAVDNAVEVGDNVVVSHNTISANQLGVSFFGGTGNNTEISDNSFTGTLSDAAVHLRGGLADDPPIANLAILRNTHSFETGGGGFLRASHTTGLRVEDNVFDGGQEAIPFASFDGSDHDWVLKSNRVSNVAADAVQVVCSYGDADGSGGGAITQNLYDNVDTAVRWVGAGKDCTGTFEVHSNAFIVPDPYVQYPGNAALFNQTSGPVHAENNYWGCQDGPGASGCASVVAVTDTAPYLVLSSTIGTKSLSTGQSTVFTADLNHNSAGSLLSTPVADGLAVSFVASTYLTVSPSQSTLVAGKASATVKAKSTPGAKGVTGQFVSASVSNSISTQSPITVRPTPPVITIQGVSTAEGTSGTHVVNFLVRLSHKFDRVVTVKYATANGTAKAPGDYTAKSGTLSFPVGATSKSIPITIKGDKVKEPNETFVVTIFSPVNATIGEPNAIGVIRNS